MADDRTPEDKATEAAIRVGATAGSALVLGTFVPGPLAVVGGAWIGAYATAQILRLRERTAAKVEAFVAQVAQKLGVTEARHEHMETPAADEVMAETIRALMNSIDEKALPVLAMLAKEYIASGRSPDRLLRGSARMVADCDADDIDEMRNLMNVLARSARGQKRLVLRQDGNSIEVTPEGMPMPTASVPTRIPRRLMHLLTVNGLAEDDGVWDGPAVALRLEAFQALARAFDHQGTG